MKKSEELMKLQDVIHIDKRFQNSINLRLDAGKNEYVKNYIPTQASIQVLAQYVRDIYGVQKMKSTLLVGPYGKGKSHLLLVLLRLLQEMESEEVQKFIEACLKTNGEFGEELLECRKNPIRMLPVIISFGREDLETSYRMALSRSLKMFGLEELSPASYYSIASEMIEKWKKNYPDTYKLFYEELGKEKAQHCIQGLKQEDAESLHVFQNLYPKLTAGSRFEPLIEIDVPKMYEEVAIALQRKYGYQGIVIVFDEFSKFLEGENRNVDSKDMALVQNMCELAQNSSNHLLYHICVAHKSIKEYAGYLSKNIIDLFTGVDGRISEIFFTATGKSNYEMIQNIIDKKESFSAFCKNKKWDIVAKSYRYAGFEREFSKEEFEEIVLRGCYPMTPITTFLLLRVSAQIGQNERSLVTFLANDEEHTLARFLSEEDSGKEMLYPDRVFDYFSNVLRKDIQNKRNHKEWQKASAALLQTKNERERQIIKTICLIRITGINEGIEARAKVLSSALNCPLEEMKEQIRELEKRELILYREKLDSYVIRQKIDVDIEGQLTKIEENELNAIDVSQTLGKLGNRQYELPRKYNHAFEMTRYFNYRFVDVNIFLSSGKDTLLKGVDLADGNILLLVDEEGKKADAVKKKVQELENKRLVVLYPNRAFGAKDIVIRLLAIEKFAKDRDKTNLDQVLLEELLILEEEYRYKLNALLNELYIPGNGVCELYYCDAWNTDNLNDGLSRICEDYYGMTPRINHELINRQHVSPQIRKAREVVIQRVLDHQSLSEWESGTSAEATIYRATLFNSGVNNKNVKISEELQRIQEIIHDFVMSADGKSQCFDSLFSVLQGEHIGLRQGIIPIYLAWELASIEGMAVVYYDKGNGADKKELPIGAKVLEQVSENPDKFELYLEKGTATKDKFLKELEVLFSCEKKSTMAERLYAIVTCMQQWFRDLPLCTFNFYMQHTMYGKMCKILLEKDMNPREFLLSQLKTILGESNMTKLIFVVQEAKKEIDSFYEELLQNAIEQVKEQLDLAEGSLTPALTSWHVANKDKVLNTVLSTKSELVFKYIENMKSHNEEIVVNEIAKILTGLYVSDWKKDTKDFFVEELQKLKNEIEKQSESNREGMRLLSFTGSDGKQVEKYLEETEKDAVYDFMMSALQSAIEDFGDSLRKEQKIEACLEVLQQIIEN